MESYLIDWFYCFVRISLHFNWQQQPEHSSKCLPRLKKRHDDWSFLHKLEHVGFPSSRNMCFSFTSCVSLWLTVNRAIRLDRRRSIRTDLSQLLHDPQTLACHSKNTFSEKKTDFIHKQLIGSLKEGDTRIMRETELKNSDSKKIGYQRPEADRSIITVVVLWYCNICHYIIRGA